MLRRDAIKLGFAALVCAVLPIPIAPPPPALAPMFVIPRRTIDASLEWMRLMYATPVIQERLHPIPPGL